jgi:hypothetical protein
MLADSHVQDHLEYVHGGFQRSEQERYADQVSIEVWICCSHHSTALTSKKTFLSTKSASGLPDMRYHHTIPCKRVVITLSNVEIADAGKFRRARQSIVSPYPCPSL